jgi:phosphate transport system substrate-binding protein
MKTQICAVVGAVILAAIVVGCDNRNGASGGKETIVVDGSDTMVNLAQAWAEAYTKTRPNVDIQVAGGGSGVGINSLIGGKVDMANSSRKMDEKEIGRFKEQNQGKEPKEHIVGLDALAVYVHRQNPLEQISIEELAEVYGDGGQITRWTQLGKSNPQCPSDEITRVSRQNNSGTYAYFREAVLGKKRDFRNGSIDQSGSKDVVALVEKTPCAIGYSGLGYKTDGVKALSVSRKKGEQAVPPNEANAQSGTYPISRPLFIYTPGEPTGAVKDFIAWCQGPEGQKIVKDVGYVPVPDKKVAMAK